MSGNNTVNYYNNNVRSTQFSAQRPEYSGGQPQLAQQAMEGAQDTYVAQRAENVETSWMTVPATAAAWFGICKGTDYFNNKLMSKEYEQTPFAKLGKIGDNITEGYRNSWFRNTKVGTALHNARVATKGFIKNIVDKNPVLSSIRDNPAIPEWKMPNIESRGLLGKHSIDVEQLLSGFMNVSEVPERLERYGFTKEQIKQVKQDLKSIPRKNRAEYLKDLELKHFGVNTSEALLDAKAKALGFNDFAHFNKLTQNMDDNAREIMNALGRIDKKKGYCFVQECGEGKGIFGKHAVIADEKCIVQETRKSILGPIRKIFKRKVTTQEIYNKYRLVLNEGAAKSKLGRMLSKGGAWFMEGATNRFAGGKMVALMQATFVAQAITAALTKGENVPDKIKTFIERNNELISYIFAAPVSVYLIFHAAGMKYAGMTKEEVKAYREAIKEFGVRNANGEFKTLKEWKTARDIIEKMRFKETNGFFTRIFQKIGGFLNIGNERFAPYISKKSLNLNMARKFGHWFKGGPLSFVVRGLLGMMVLMPLVTKTTTKISNAIFGKPKHSLLDEEKEAAEAEAAQKELEMQAQLDALKQDAAARQQAGIDYEQQMANNQNAEANGLLQPYINQQNVQPQGQQVYVPQEQPVIIPQTQPAPQTEVPAQTVNNEPKRTYIPSSEGVKIQPEHSYVPSSEGVKLNAPDYSAAEQALAKSAAIENEVMRVLSMK